MNVKELKEILSRVEDDSIEVVIDAETYAHGVLGGIDCTGVKCAYKGFDWDSNKFILFPETKLSAKTYRSYNKAGEK